MVGLFKIVSFISIVVGVFYAAKIDIFQFVEDISKPFENQKLSIKKKALLATGKKKKNNVTILIEETRNTLRLTRKEEMFPKLCILSLGLGIVGIILGMSLSNVLIVPVLAVFLGIIPFTYVKILGIKLTKQLNDELETALSIITSSYVRTESIVVAVEENLSYLNHPVKEVFNKFYIQTKMYNPNIKKNISDMKKQLNNDVFREWCDILIACQDDKNIKNTLTPIVKKLSNIRLVSARLDALLYAPVKEYISMVLLLLANVPLLYFLNKDWFNILMLSVPGKTVLAICATVILISALAVIKITRPIEYRR